MFLVPSEFLASCANKWPPRTEEERAIQAACDKKRKKRAKPGGKEAKTRRPDGAPARMFEAARELETSNRLSQVGISSKQAF